MKTIQNIVVSNVQPTSKSVLWADTSKSSKTPLKIYKDGSWVSCGLGIPIVYIKNESEMPENPIEGVLYLIGEE